MKRYLITPSLHNSWSWYKKLDIKTKEDFLNTLNKVQLPKTEAMLAGIKFEDDVLKFTEGKEVIGDEAYKRCVAEIGEVVSGGLWQESVSKEVSFGGMDFLLYGKSDVMKRDWIYDIKFTSNYDIGKFQDTVQHSTYMECSGIHKFGYLVTDGKNVWREDYFHTEYDRLLLNGELATMMENIMSDAEFRKAYLENWATKEERHRSTWQAA